MNSAFILSIFSVLCALLNLGLATIALIAMMAGGEVSELIPKFLLLLIAPTCTVVSIMQIKKEDPATSKLMSVLSFIFTIIVFIIPSLGR